MSKKEVAMDTIKCKKCGKAPKIIDSPQYYVDRGWPYTFACECRSLAGETPEEAKALWIDAQQGGTLYKERWSPFAEYRPEIMGGYGVAEKLRELVLHLYNHNNPIDLGGLLVSADKRHREIIIELLKSYAERGESDDLFMDLAEEIRAGRDKEKRDQKP